MPVTRGQVAADLLDVSPRALGDAYIAALDASTRLQEGRHYTPGTLAAVLWDELQRAGCTPEQVVDPACGAASLLIPHVQAVAQSAGSPRSILGRIERTVSGTDLDPIAVWIGNTVLAAEMLPAWARLRDADRTRLPVLLRVGDGLGAHQDRPSAIVMNPPYGRVRLASEERARWEPTLYGHANRYALFLQAAIERVAPNGFVAALVPTSFLGGSYYRRLRHFVAQHAPMVRVTFVESRSGVFVGDVLQETCIAIFRKGRRRRVACSQVTVNGSVGRNELPAAPALARRPEPWLIPRRARDGSLVTAAARMPARLDEYGWRASTGPLVWNRHRPQISSTARKGCIPILWAADLEPGAVSRSRNRDSQRWFTPRPRDEFMALSEPAVLVKRTTAPEQPRRLIAALLDAPALREWNGKVVVENHVNVLRCSHSASPLTPELLESLLNTETLDRLYRCLTGTVAVSAYELGALPLPSAHQLESLARVSKDDFAGAVATMYGDEAP